jgi:hypothetical protein
LPADLGQSVLNGGFDLPEVGRLPDTERAVPQVGKEVRGVRAEVRKEVLIGGQLEILAADLQRQHFFIAQRWGKSAAPQGVGVFDHLLLLTDQTIHRTDNLLPIHWCAPLVKSWCGNPYSTKKSPNGSEA